MSGPEFSREPRPVFGAQIGDGPPFQTMASFQSFCHRGPLLRNAPLRRRRPRFRFFRYLRDGPPSRHLVYTKRRISAPSDYAERLDRLAFRERSNWKLGVGRADKGKQEFISAQTFSLAKLWLSCARATGSGCAGKRVISVRDRGRRRGRVNEAAKKRSETWQRGYSIIDGPSRDRV